MLILTIQSGSAEAQTFKLTKEKTVLGRHPACDIVLNDPTVSKRHSVLTLHQGDLVLIDGDGNQPSTNGVFVNKIRVKHKQILRPKDVIQIGSFRITVHQEAGKKQSPKETEEEFYTVEKTVVTQTGVGHPSHAPEEDLDKTVDFRAPLDSEEDTGHRMKETFPMDTARPDDDRDEGVEPTSFTEVEPTVVSAPAPGKGRAEPRPLVRDLEEEDETAVLDESPEALNEENGVTGNFIEVKDEENNYHRKFNLGRGTQYLGNNKNPNNDIVLVDGFVSKVHGRFFYDKARRLYFYEDLGSRNGSWVNGVQISQNSPQIISNGDKLRVGKTRIRVTLVEN